MAGRPSIMGVAPEVRSSSLAAYPISCMEGAGRAECVGPAPTLMVPGPRPPLAPEPVVMLGPDRVGLAPAPWDIVRPGPPPKGAPQEEVG